MRAVRSFTLTLIVSYLICLLWMGLETVFYGEVQPRVVDDIVMMVFMVIMFVAFYKAFDKENSNKGGISND